MVEAAAPALAGKDAVLLVLGVTPELIAAEWPGQARMVAVDSSAGMIASLWRPNAGTAEAICARWQDMPLDDASVSAAIGDASLNALPSFQEYPLVLRQLARVMRPGGVLALRCFLRPEQPDSPAEVAARTLSGEFDTISAFRFRLAIALAGADGAVSLGDLPPVIDRLFPDRDALAEATGWPRGEIDSTDKISGSIPATFPTEAEVMRAAEPWFEPVAIRTADYSEAELCPTLVWRRR